MVEDAVLSEPASGKFPFKWENMGNNSHLVPFRHLPA